MKHHYAVNAKYEWQCQQCQKIWPYPSSPDTSSCPAAEPKWLWLEEYSCGCSNVTATKAQASGSCQVHGTDRRRLIEVPGTMKKGFSRGCLVPFCRSACPVLPEDANVMRASGLALCDICGKGFDAHPKFAYPTGMKHVAKGCDGVYYHL